MKKSKCLVIEADLKNIEKERIIEMKSLSYLDRLERLMILIEVSYTLEKINKISFGIQ